jgi:hypothetical protein
MQRCQKKKLKQHYSYTHSCIYVYRFINAIGVSRFRLQFFFMHRLFSFHFYVCYSIMNSLYPTSSESSSLPLFILRGCNQSRFIWSICCLSFLGRVSTILVISCNTTFVVEISFISIFILSWIHESYLPSSFIFVPKHFKGQSVL